MSVIAHYYYRQQSATTLPAVNETGVVAVAAPAAHPAARALATTASFQHALSTSQKQVAPEITPSATLPSQSVSRQPASKSTTPNLEQLVKFAHAQGWSERQIALMKRLSLRKNSRTGKLLNENSMPVAARAANRHIRQNIPNVGTQDVGSIRGIRNNNPGNLEASGQFQWQGQTGSDGRFATFSSPEHGIRALGMNLLSYHRRGLDTISKVISRWAPPQDNNDTSAYIRRVSQALGVSPHERLDLTEPSVLSALSQAIIRQENGTIPFDEQVINKGIFSALGLENLAGVKQAVQDFSRPLQGKSIFPLQISKMPTAEIKALRQSLNKQIKAVKIIIQAGGEVANIPSKAELVAAWGYTEGSQRFDALKRLLPHR